MLAGNGGVQGQSHALNAVGVRAVGRQQVQHDHPVAPAPSGLSCWWINALPREGGRTGSAVLTGQSPQQRDESSAGLRTPLHPDKFARLVGSAQE